MLCARFAHNSAMTTEIEAISAQLMELKEKLNQLRAEAPPEKVEDFTFETPSGPVKLSELFGDQSELLLIHNMGASCNYCTLWADGFSGYLRHFRERAAFVLVSPDTPENQAKLAAARDWKFRMVQDASRDFSTAMGYWSEKDGWWPGVSAFHKDAEGTIWRTGKDVFGPGDDYCMVWPAFSLLKGGQNGWEPH